MREGDDGDAILAPIRTFAGGQDDRVGDHVGQVVAELVPQPQQVTEIVSCRGLRRLRLDRDDPPVVALDEEVHLAPER